MPRSRPLGNDVDEPESGTPRSISVVRSVEWLSTTMTLKFKTGFLVENTLNGIENRPLTIFDWNDDAGLEPENCSSEQADWSKRGSSHAPMRFR